LGYFLHQQLSAGTAEFHQVVRRYALRHFDRHMIRTRIRPFLYVLAVVTLANSATYWSLCRPELQMQNADSRYLQRVLGNAGGVWSLSLVQRCLVHFAVTTAIVLGALALGAAITRARRRRAAR